MQLSIRESGQKVFVAGLVKVKKLLVWALKTSKEEEIRKKIEWISKS